jgi:hypothetical protein
MSTDLLCAEADHLCTTTARCHVKEPLPQADVLKELGSRLIYGSEYVW